VSGRFFFNLFDHPVADRGSDPEQGGRTWLQRHRRRRKLEIDDRSPRRSGGGG
jgi:hypothetical protein